MSKAFKNFWKDYMELVKVSVKWFKKHWKGYLLLSAVVGAIYGLVAWFDIRCFKKKLGMSTKDFKEELDDEN